MSLDYSVVFGMGFNERSEELIRNYLIQNGFYQDAHGYLSREPGKFIEIYLVENPGDEEFWRDAEGLTNKIGFIPQGEILITSRHTRSSHRAALELAVKLAESLGGFVYNHQDGNILLAKELAERNRKEGEG